VDAEWTSDPFTGVMGTAILRQVYSSCMHPSVRSFTLLGLSALLIAALIGFVLTRQTANSAIPREPARSDQQAQAQLVD